MYWFVANLSGLADKQNNFFVSLQLVVTHSGQGDLACSGAGSVNLVLRIRTVEKNRIVIRTKARNNGAMRSTR
jgi:hypothetical protein